ncbi:pirin family protein [Azospirillum sp. TSO35-2]|uniref:pirin family protein n=1 Tax=Azospirillum sp. TSO35-2 TaxID=716796 RepID=UPI000D61A759|nr:pirin family protein [Azospirillum sp. TSO35-2]PWC39531.1 quercetin 2,3-dioxygenase [Azospirillum sp. TSO35-2]
MITIRHRDERGVADMGWLNSHHSFSFGHYMDPNHMGFRALRVINEDRVIPGAGFPTHGHANMEIISYVLKGALEHKDSIGTGSIIRPGEVQRMSAGRGIRHSEYNASDKDPVHFLQIWILPEAHGLAPGYEQADFPAAEKRGTLKLVGSRDGREGSVTIHQDVDLYAALLEGDESARLALRPGRHAWVQVARGQVHVNGQLLKEGDGAALSDEEAVTLDRADEAEVLVFDLA